MTIRYVLDSAEYRDRCSSGRAVQAMLQGDTCAAIHGLLVFGDSGEEFVYGTMVPKDGSGLTLLSLQYSNRLSYESF
jgi:hypothetical protein